MATETVSIGTDALLRSDMTIAQGADNTYIYRYSTKADNVSPAVPVNLAGWSARAQVRSTVAGDVWISLTSGAGITLTSAGLITLTIGHALTETAEWNYRTLGVWDLELINPGGNVMRFTEGSVIISQDVTRAS